MASSDGSRYVLCHLHHGPSMHRKFFSDEYSSTLSLHLPRCSSWTFTTRKTFLSETDSMKDLSLSIPTTTSPTLVFMPLSNNITNVHAYIPRFSCIIFAFDLSSLVHIYIHVHIPSKLSDEVLIVSSRGHSTPRIVID